MEKNIKRDILNKTKIENIENFNNNNYSSNNFNNKINRLTKIKNDFSPDKNCNDIQKKNSLKKEIFSEKDKKYKDIIITNELKKVGKNPKLLNNINHNCVYIKDFICVNKLQTEIPKIKERLIYFILEKEYQTKLYK